MRHALLHLFKACHSLETPRLGQVRRAADIYEMNGTGAAQPYYSPAILAAS